MADIVETSKPDSNECGPSFNQKSGEDPAWKCRHDSGPNVRNLVVCIDGTANQFGQKNTNVIELYNLIRKEVGANQLTWYNSGIGTYARPSWKSLEYYRQVIDHKIDLAIAWNFGRTILAAYRWLSMNYKNGDRIFLFGFSRGAFQVRVLSAMIDKVGLIHQGNEEQIPFAYALYADPDSGVARNDGLSMAERFKKTFSHETADVHYVGVWDTVSSIGVIRGKHMLPGTVDGMKHVCFFRHALALDERRVKFTPEYAFGGSATESLDSTPAPPDTSTEMLPQPQNDTAPQILEVWFAGTHSDIGGGNVANEAMDRSRPPLRWMVFESSAAGLRTKPFQRDLLPKEQIEFKESLTGVWWILEWLPLNRLTYTRRTEGKPTTHKPHMGKARKIHRGQKIHGSLIRTDKEEYTPRALPLHGDPLLWTNYRTQGLGEWQAADLFTGIQHLVNRFLDLRDGSVWVQLRRTVTMDDGRQAVYEATLDTLRSSSTSDRATLSTKVELIRNITDILHESQETGTPLRPLSFDSKIVKEAFDNFRTSGDEHAISIARTFLCSFTKLTIEPRGKLTDHLLEGDVRTIAISPDGQRIISALSDSTIQCWDTATGTRIGEPFTEHTDDIGVIVASWNGRLIASGSRDGTVCLWNVEGGMLAQLSGHTGSVRSLAFSPDGKWMASGSWDETVRIWDIDRKVLVGEPLAGHQGVVHAVGFSCCGRKIISCSFDGTVRIWDWDFKTHRPVADPLIVIVGSDSNYLLSVTLSLDGNRLAAGSLDGSVHIWDLEKRTMVGNGFVLHRGVVCSMAFSPDTTKIALGFRDGTVLVWDVETQQLENRFQHEDWVNAVEFFPDGKSVATGCDDGTIRIWSADPLPLP